MKRHFITLILLALSVAVWGQHPAKSVTKQAPLSKEFAKMLRHDFKGAKTLSCVDTLHYPLAKEMIDNDTALYLNWLWETDAESMSQTFYLSGATATVNGFEFYARKDPSTYSDPALVVNGAVYSVDGSNIPTTLLGSATLSINDTNYAFRVINFSTPITVTGNYAIVLTPTNTDGILELVCNDGAISATYDEGLSKMKSTYYAPSGGNWVSLPVISAGWPGGPYDYEMIVAPYVTYSINAGFTVAPGQVCLGQQVTFTNTTTPASVLSNRMYNWNAFESYFLSQPDSAFAYDMDGVSPLVWSSNPTYTYASASTYAPTLYVLGGFWKNCLDYSVGSVTVNPLPTVSFTLSPDVICDTADAIALSGGSPASGTYSGTGVSAGMFDPAVAGVGAHTLTYTYTDANTCTNNSTDVMTVDLCVGIETASISGWLISPNPVSDQLFISFNKATTDETAIQILSPEGRIVYNEKVSSASFNGTIDVSSLAKGLYIIRLVTGTEAVYNKIIVE